MTDLPDTPARKYIQSDPTKELLADLVAHIAASSLGGTLDVDNVLATLAACHRYITIEHERANHAEWRLQLAENELTRLRRRAYY